MGGWHLQAVAQLYGGLPQQAPSGEVPLQNVPPQRYVIGIINASRCAQRANLAPVYADGSICLDILQNQWSPIYDIAAILTSIQSLLSDPNPNSPANSEAARLFQENKREYNRRVKEVVERSWQLEEGAGAAAKPPA